MKKKIKPHELAADLKPSDKTLCLLTDQFDVGPMTGGPYDF